MLQKVVILQWHWQFRLKAEVKVSTVKQCRCMHVSGPETQHHIKEVKCISKRGALLVATITTQMHAHTPFNGPLSRTTQISRYQKGKTNLDFTEARDSEWQWHQLGHMQVWTSLQTNNHASTPPLSFFTGRMPFLPPNQQRQSTEGKSTEGYYIHNPTNTNLPNKTL